MINVYRKPIILLETVEMLFKFANGISFETVKSDYIRKYSFKRDEAWIDSVCKKTAILSKIMTDACYNLDQKDPNLQYFFCGYSSAVSSAKICLAQIITWILGSCDIDFDLHIQNLKETWRLKIERNDPIMLTPGFSLQYARDVAWNINFAEQLDSLQFPEEFRWRVFKLVSNTDHYIDELANFIRPIASRLSLELEKYIADMEPVYKLWEEYFTKKSFSDFASAFCNVDASFSPAENLRFYLGFMNASSVLSEIDANENRDWIVQTGCLIDDEISFDSKKLFVDEICEMLKVLSDKSKFVILQSIGHSPAYGVELAEQMGLTNATISRHMNTLYNSGLITAQKDNTKIFYKTNKEHLAKFLRSLSDELLK